MAQSRRDQLQAYRFMQRRVRTALLDADPDTSDAPLSRMTTATLAGIMVAVLLLAGAGIYGLIRPGGSTAWKSPGALIVERETSTRYVYLDNVLYQVANFSSAKLLLGDRLKVVSVSGNSLSSARHGGSIGIPGAPDYVPDPGRVAAAPWSICVSGDLAATGAGASVPMQFQPGVTATGERLTGERALLLKADSSWFLVWNDHAFEVPARWLSALRLGNGAHIDVSAQFVATLPRGETLQPVVVPGTGQPGPAVPGFPQTTVGQVFEDNQNAALYYLLTASGLVYLTPLQATLQLADPATQAVNGRPGAIQIDSTTLTGQAIGTLPNRPPADQQGPKTIPQLATPGAAEQLCAVYPPTGAVTVVYGDEPAEAAGAAAAGLVRLSTGWGALVSAVSGADQTVGTTYLVTDTGQKFVVKDAKTLATLGLPSSPVAHLPGAVIGEIPGAVVLDPAAALQVAGAGAAPSPQPS